MIKPIKKILIKIKGPIWIGIVILLISITIIIFSSQILYQRTVNLLTDNLRERILTISITAAANISPSNLSALQTEEDWQKPEWAMVVNRLHKAKYSNDDIVFMYIFRKTKDDPTQMEFVADADSIDPNANTSGDPSRYVDVNRDGKIEPDGPDKLQWPGQPYPEAVDIPEAFEAYNGPLTSKDLYTDEYGTVITGYAPIKDENDNVVAILATDIKADDFFTITTQTLRPFIIFIVFLTSIISILTIVLIYAWRRYAKFLEKSNDDKTKFVSFATHQIRAPLTAIKGYASLILEGEYGEIPDKVKEAAQIMYKSAHNLVGVVGDYLDISRIELGKMKYDFAPIDLTPTIKQLVAELQPNLIGKELTLTFAPKNPDDLCSVSVDAGKIKQVVGNLVDNAIKYTPKGSIVVSIEHKTDNKVLISIVDTGVGVDEATKAKLFQRFSRADDAHAVNATGTGLGLYIVRQMVEAHHGRVWVESEGKGKGSQFYIELPTDLEQKSFSQESPKE